MVQGSFDSAQDDEQREGFASHSISLVRIP